jgi:hypothetical protein
VNNFCKLALTLTLAAGLSGCVVSFTNPLPASQPLGRDERLLGKWEGHDEQGNAGWFRFEIGSANEMNVFGSGDLGHPAFRAVTTKISGSDYMILWLNNADIKDYIIARYSTNENKLTVCLLSVDKVRDAIKKRKLKGRFDYSPSGGALITESSKRVLDLLKSPHRKDLFVCLPELKKVSSK